MKNALAPISFIATDRPTDARVFFGDVLGLPLLEDTPFALVFADGGHTLRVQIVPDVQPNTFTAHGWHIADIHGEIDALVAKGVHFLQFDQLLQDEKGVWVTPNGDKIAWFNDPSGNILSLTQHDEA